MLFLVMVIYFMSIRENDPRTLNNWNGSTILAHADLEHANNDPFRFNLLASKYADIDYLSTFFYWVKGRNMGT